MIFFTASPSAARRLLRSVIYDYAIFLTLCGVFLILLRFANRIELAGVDCGMRK